MLARKLDELGFYVYACCSFPDGDGVEKLKMTASNRLHVLGMDLTKDEDVQKAFNYVKGNLGTQKLWAVICNANQKDEGEILWTSKDALTKVISSNFLGTVHITKAFLPLLCQSKGRVITISNGGGYFSLLGMAAYCSSKNAVISFCDSLRTEMYKFGVKVVSINPWTYRTGMTTQKTATLKDTWDSAPEEIKSLLGKDYLDAYTKHTRNFENMYPSHNLSEVLLCLEEAIMAENPKQSYNLTPLKTKVIFLALQTLPKAVTDLLMLGPSLKH